MAIVLQNESESEYEHPERKQKNHKHTSQEELAWWKTSCVCASFVTRLQPEGMAFVAALNTAHLVAFSTVWVAASAFKFVASLVGVQFYSIRRARTGISKTQTLLRVWADHQHLAQT